MSDSPLLIVGLGNPGPEYADTRHNLGFRVIDELSRRWPDVRFGNKYEAELAQVKFRSHRVLLLKPMTFMNLSGKSVWQTAKFFQVPPEKILVMFDDLDIPSGTLRVREFGGAGGHNGMRSIIDSIGTDKFPRLRLGIGRPPGDTSNYVLGRFSAGEKPAIEELVVKACGAVEVFVEEGLKKAMNTFNTKDKKE